MSRPLADRLGEKPRIAVVLCGLLLASCGGGRQSGAPEILYGEDTCDHCRMVISEERHAAGARLGGRGYRFDDPGCLRGFLRAQGAGAEIAAWVHDETGSWRPFGEAWFVVDPEGRTPMASGILAFSSEQTAAAAKVSAGRPPLRWHELETGD